MKRLGFIPEFDFSRLFSIPYHEEHMQLPEHQMITDRKQFDKERSRIRIWDLEDYPDELRILEDPMVHIFQDFPGYRIGPHKDIYEPYKKHYPDADVVSRLWISLTPQHPGHKLYIFDDSIKYQANEILYWPGDTIHHAINDSNLSRFVMIVTGKGEP